MLSPWNTLHCDSCLMYISRNTELNWTLWIHQIRPIPTVTRQPLKNQTCFLISKDEAHTFIKPYLGSAQLPPRLLLVHRSLDGDWLHSPAGGGGCHRPGGGAALSRGGRTWSCHTPGWMGMGRKEEEEKEEEEEEEDTEKNVVNIFKSNRYQIPKCDKNDNWPESPVLWGGRDAIKPQS